MGKSFCSTTSGWHGNPLTVVGKNRKSTEQQLWENSEQLSDAVIRMWLFLADRHPVKTAEVVAAQLGITADGVRKWKMGLGAPSFWVFWRLVDLYGRPLLVAMYGHDYLPPWLVDSERARDLAEIRAGLSALEAQIARLDSAG